MSHIYFLSYNIQHAEDTGKSSHRRAFAFGVDEAGALCRVYKTKTTSSICS